MEHTPAERLEWIEAPEENFTGRVWFGSLSQAEDRPLNALGVLFAPEARTEWTGNQVSDEDYGPG